LGWKNLKALSLCFFVLFVAFVFKVLDLLPKPNINLFSTFPPLCMAKPAPNGKIHPNIGEKK